MKLILPFSLLSGCQTRPSTSCLKQSLDGDALSEKNKNKKNKNFKLNLALNVIMVKVISRLL
jgi:hypothetical protein